MMEHTYLPLLLEAWRGNPSPLKKEELFPISHRVREISHGLTGSRELAGSLYLDDPVSLGAYLFYYWPISYRAASFILSSKPSPSSRIDSALDIGAGTGPVSFALIDQGVKTVVSCDRSERALNILKRIAQRRHAPIRTHMIDLEKGQPLPRGTFQLITLGNVLNELWKDRPDRIKRRFLFVKSLASSLDPDGRIVILEPALASTAKELLQVRDLLTCDGELCVEAPCFRQAACPALPNGTCHREIPWDPPFLVREIGRRARVSDRRSVKTAYLILRHSTLHSLASSPPPSPEGLPHRVVSDPLTSKSGRVRYLLCGEWGRFPLSADNAKAPYRPKGEYSPPEPSRRKLSPSGQPRNRPLEGLPTRNKQTRADSQDPFSVFFSLKRGDVVVFQQVEKRETGYGIRQDSILRIPHPGQSPGGTP